MEAGDSENMERQMGEEFEGKKQRPQWRDKIQR